jgi:predicted glycogen debranching enzyme
VRSRLFQALSSAADAYTVEVDDRAAVLAGFPWFDVWTRDTFTAFTGLFLATGRFALARKVLATFAPLVRRGMLPSNLPGGDVTPEYHAADASFWFVLCVARYIERSGDRDALDAFAWSAVRAIVDGHIRGEPACVRVDDDGLLTASSAEGPLTWMDAVFDGRVMTPRRGKPVELQALWLHALRVADDLGRASGDHAFAEQCRSLRDRGVSAFRRRFWCAERGYLYDVVDGPDGDDATLRPNQVFALALDSELLPRDQALHVLDVLHDRLLAPYGLRTLAADDPAYHPYYCGDRSRRDPAYHQGTVWPFLLGPFLSAWIHLRGSEPLARERAGAMLTALEEAIDTSGCMGHLAEIFDGTAPHEPRGCFAQAWSVGELLSAMRDCGL